MPPARPLPYYDLATTISPGERMTYLGRLHEGSGKRAARVWMLLALLPVACAGGTPPGPPIHVNLSEVSDVHIQPVPEGPSASFGRVPGPGAQPLEQILRFIPQPLPAPIPQSCDRGGTLTIRLDAGREIDY